MLYALLNKKKLFGLFTDLKLCNIAIQGFVSNKLIPKENLVIVAYHENSITKADIQDSVFEDEQNESFTSNNTTTEELDSTETRTKKDERKKKIEYNLHILKQRKDRIEESKNTYNVDVELYQKFKKIKSENDEFEIPEMFIEKYTLMSVLEEEGNLNWEYFYNNYKKSQMNNSYSMLFEGCDAKDRELIILTENDDYTSSAGKSETTDSDSETDSASASASDKKENSK